MFACFLFLSSPLPLPLPFAEKALAEPGPLAERQKWTCGAVAGDAELGVRIANGSSSTIALPSHGPSGILKVPARDPTECLVRATSVA